MVGGWIGDVEADTKNQIQNVDTPSFQFFNVGLPPRPSMRAVAYSLKAVIHNIEVGAEEDTPVLGFSR
jgi:hypothetical protein